MRRVILNMKDYTSRNKHCLLEEKRHRRFSFYIVPSNATCPKILSYCTYKCKLHLMFVEEKPHPPYNLRES